MQTLMWILEEGKSKRTAIVNSFGFGGTNFCVLMEYDDRARTDYSDVQTIVYFEKDSFKDLKASIDKAADLLTNDYKSFLDYVNGQQATKSKNASYRLAFSGSKEKLISKFSLIEKFITEETENFEHPSGIYYSTKEISETPSTCLLFSGR